MNASIVILTRNAGDLIKSVMANVYSQDYKEEYEVLVIDSSSEDNTLNIARQYSPKIITIDPKDFGHGKTRNLGAQIARGKYLVFLTHDAVPRNTEWLREITRHLDDERIAGVFGRQVARSNATPMEQFFYHQMYGDKRILWNRSNLRYDDIIFSNANSATRRHFLLKHPFPEDILMSEDRKWALAMINKGYNILYQPSAMVTHSHDTATIQVFKRYFDFGVSHSEIGNKTTKSMFVGKGMSVFWEESKYLISHGKPIWIPRALFYNLAKFAGLLIGRNHKYIPKSIKLRLSGYRGYWK